MYNHTLTIWILFYEYSDRLTEIASKILTSIGYQQNDIRFYQGREYFACLHRFSKTILSKYYISTVNLR
jgi:hypothetical protein